MAKRTSVHFDRKSSSFVGLEAAHIQQLKEAYKGINVDAELIKMGLWLQSPKGKDRKGEMSFIMNWLNNASPKGKVPTTNEQLTFMAYDSPVRPFLLDYLQDLWKGKEHLFQFNKIKRQT